MKNILIIIDAQQDFCKPGAPLYVPGAEQDVKRIANFIENTELEHIVVSMDWHQPFSIFHQSFWKDIKGNQPPVFSQITYKDFKDGKWIPQAAPVTTGTYLQELEENGEYTHTIWPDHCIAGTEGAALMPDITNALKKWSVSGNKYETILKGRETLTEFYGIFKAQVTLPNVASTDWNLDMLLHFKKFDNIYIAGQAKSHCVAQTIKQLFEFPHIRRKVTVLEDCMSNVTGFETIADHIWDKAKELGIKFAKSTEK